MIKIAVILSILMNAILIGYVIGYIELFLFLSILIISGLVWYIAKILNHYNEVDNDFSDMLQNMADFESHVAQIYEMEMFYGDETLKEMIDHIGQLRINLPIFQILMF